MVEKGVGEAGADTPGAEPDAAAPNPGSAAD
jgi:hypothetical protein